MAQEVLLATPQQRALRIKQRLVNAGRVSWRRDEEEGEEEKVDKSTYMHAVL